MASGATIAVSKIVFMLFSLLFDLAAAIARVLDFCVPLPDHALLSLPDENLVGSRENHDRHGFTTFPCLRRLERGMAVRLER
jgi:hypothetical protein